MTDGCLRGIASSAKLRFPSVGNIIQFLFVIILVNSEVNNKFTNVTS